MKLVFTSDLHVGLKVDGKNINNDIHKSVTQVVNHCIHLSRSGEKVVLFIGGDIFNNNVPSEEDIATFISIINPLKAHDIKVIVIAGNHDTIYDPERLSCLGFIRKLSVGYENLELHEDIGVKKLGVFDNGPHYILLLPHITSANVERQVRAGKLKEVIPVQDYIDMRVEKILKKIGPAGSIVAISHLNIVGAHGGSEENLLKKSTAYLPECLIGNEMVTVLNGHIHSSCIYKENVMIVGSPIFCGFGERDDDKFFCELTMSRTIGTENDVELKPLKTTKYMQLELDLMTPLDAIEDSKEYVDFIESVKSFDGDKYVKITPTVTPETNVFNWRGIEDSIRKIPNTKIKPINPIIVITKRSRNADIKIGLSPEDSVKTYIKTNVKKDKELRKAIWKEAKQYL